MQGQNVLKIALGRLLHQISVKFSILMYVYPNWSLLLCGIVRSCWSFSARELAHSLVSLSMATSLEEDLVTTSSAGFLCMWVCKGGEKGRTFTHISSTLTTDLEKISLSWWLVGGGGWLVQDRIAVFVGKYFAVSFLSSLSDIKRIRDTCAMSFYSKINFPGLVTTQSHFQFTSCLSKVMVVRRCYRPWCHQAF